MKIEDIRDDEAPSDTTEEAAEELAADDYEPYTDEERAAMSPEQRAEVVRIEQAIEEFLARTKTYLQTPENRKAILGFLNDHDLRITPTSLLLAFEELSEGGELELAEGDTQDQADDDEEQPDLSARLATAQLARGNRGESEEDAEESEPEAEEPTTARGKPVAGWRNGRRLEVGA